MQQVRDGGKPIAARFAFATLAFGAGAIRIGGMNIARIFVVGLVALVGGCASTPVLLNASPEGVVVRYSQGSTTSADAVAAAAKHCAQYGRQAVQGDGNSATGDTFVSFTCQKPGTP